MRVATMFSSIKNVVSKLVGLEDDDVENLLDTPDRTQVEGSTGLTSVDQAAVTGATVGRVIPERFRAAIDIAGTKTAVGEKYFYVHHADWQESQNYGHKLISVCLENKLLENPLAVTGLSAFHRYMRFGLDVMFQVNCTQYQQGVLMCCLIPGDEGNGSINAYTIYPHGILNCNINNSARVEVPWVCTRPYKRVGHLTVVWRVVVWVVSPLKRSQTTTNNCTVTVTARFTNLEFHGMCPTTKAGDDEGILTLGPSCYVANLCNRRGASATLNMSLADEKFLKDDSCAGGISFTHFKQLTRVPTLGGKFNFSKADEVGKLLWVAPVCPQWFEENTTLIPKDNPTALASVAAQYIYWNADIVYHFQAAITRFHSGRIIFFYLPGTDSNFDDVKKVKLNNVTNCACAIFDICGIGSTCVFRVPWCCETPYAVTQSGINSGTKPNVPKCTGFVGAMVYSRLNCPFGVHESVEINVYMSACNCEFKGPIWTKPLGKERIDTTRLYSNAGEREVKEDVVPTQDSSDSYGTGGSVDQQKVQFDDPPQQAELDIPAGAVTSIEDPYMMTRKPITFPQLEHGKRRHTADHMLIKNWTGRAHHYTAVSLNPKSRTEVSVPITFARPPGGSPNMSQYMSGPLQWFFSTFHVFRGPLDVTVEVEGGVDQDITLWFAPQGSDIPPVWVEGTANKIMPYKAALGVVRFNTTQTSNVQLRLPFYIFQNGLSAFSPLEEDQLFGTLVFEVGSINKKRQEDVRFHIFISFPEECEFYFPRAPGSFSLMPDSTITTWQQEMGAAIENLLEEHPSMVEAPEEVSRPFVRNLHSAVYRGLRMQVGEHRLRYAKEELKAQNEDDGDEFGAYVCALAMEEELYTNAGYLFDDATLLHRKSGGVVQKGVAFAGNVYTIETDNKHLTGMPAIRNTRFVALVQTNEWLNLGLTCKMEHITAWANFNFGKLKFNYKKFVDKNFEEAFPKSDYDLMVAVMGSDLHEFLTCFVPKQLGLLDKCVEGSEFGTSVKLASVGAIDLMNETKEMMQKFQEATSRVVQSFAKKKRNFIIKVVSTVTKFAIRMFVCVRSNWDGVTVAAICAELGLDCLDCTMNVTGLVSNMMKELNILALDKQELEAQSIELKDCVAAASLIRSTKGFFDWVMKFLTKWFEENFGHKERVLQAIVENETKIAALLEAANGFAIGRVPEGYAKDEYKYGLELSRQLMTLQLLVNKDSELRPFSQPLRDAFQSCQRKLLSLGTDKTDAVIRAEPEVCYIFGERGSGKSLLSMAVAVKVCKQLGLPYKENIYTKPPGGDFWDGYDNQCVVLFDDIGQSSDDGDWKQFCQLVSGVPFRCDMADLSDKGKHFNSPLLICTSNMENPDPMTVHHRDAITRRLHTKIQVRAREYYCRNVGGFSVLDVAKAKRDGSIKDMSCCQIMLGNDEVTLDELVQLLVENTLGRMQNHAELLDLWAQSNCPLWFLRSYPPVDRKLSFMQCISEHKVMLLSSAIGLLSLIGLGFLGYKLFKNKNTKMDADGVYEGMPSKKKMCVVPLNKPTQHSQSIVELSVLVQGNLVKIGVSDDGDFARWKLNGLCLKGEYILVPYHGIKFEDYNFLMVFKKGVVFSQPVENVEMYELGDSYKDLVVIRVPGMPKAKDIVNHIISRDKMELCEGYNSTLATINGGVFQLMPEGPIELLEKVSYQHLQDGKNMTLTIGHAWRGQGEALNGSCGGALISGNQKLGTPIIGIHVASGGGKMISTAIWRELFEDLGVVSQSRIRRVDVVSSNCYISSTSSYSATVLKGHVPSSGRAPAAMPYSKTVAIDVMSSLVHNYNKQELEEPRDYVKSVCAVTDEIIKVVGAPEYKPLTMEQAICGIPGLDGINFRTSPGFPYVQYHLRKDDLLDRTGYIKNLYVAERVEQQTMSVWNGNPADIVFQCAAKDELRTIEKVEKGSTRFIMCGPVCFTLTFRKLLGNAIAKLQSHPGWRTHIAVGVDPDVDWNSLMHEAVRFADEGIDVDIRRFDASVSGFMLKHALQVLSDLSCLPHTAALGLFRSLTLTKVQLGHVRLLISGCLPSGCPSTSILNSLMNAFNVNYAISKSLAINPFDVSKVVKFMVYGDDIIMVLKRGVEFPGYFLEDFVKEMAKLGMEVTASDKSQVRKAKVLDLKFLKRVTTVDVHGLFHPAIDKATIWALAEWKRKNATLEDNLNDAAWFAFHWGVEFYKEFVGLLTQALMVNGVRFRVPSYEEQMLRFLCLDHVE